MELTTEDVDALADALLTAELEASPIDPPTASHPGMGVDDAYAVQLRGRALREARGARIVGRKVGLTSKAMQDLLGVREPDFGYLTEAMVHPDGATLPSEGLIAPRVEAEIAFRLKHDLQGDVDRDTALAAVEAVAPAIEVVDSRVRDWKITLPDTVADNASSGQAVIGAFVPLADLDLAAVEMTIVVERADTETIEDLGRGDAVLGHPAEALAWLARALAPYGEGIAAGEVVIPGAMHKAVDVRQGDVVRADFAGLGVVTASFGARL